MERRRCQALLDADTDALAGMLSDDLTFMHANAVADDATALLRKMRGGTIVYHELKVSEEKVTDLGGAAILASRLTAEVSVGGARKSIDNRTLSIWRKETGGWKLIA